MGEPGCMRGAVFLESRADRMDRASRDHRIDAALTATYAHADERA